MRWPVVALALLLGSSTAVIAAPAANVTVYLDRDGHVDDESGATIPAYRGNERQWAATTACVKQHFAPFRIDVVERRPTGFDYITVVVGGKASAVGLDDRTTNGVGPYTGKVIRNATVFVFSEIGTREKDIENVCAVIAHEAGHALGLEHTYYCGDLMSYFLDKCGARKFIDVNAPCGEHAKRECATGEASQNSYRRLVALVGLRGGTAPADDSNSDADTELDAGEDASDTDDADDTDDVDPWGSNDVAEPSSNAGDSEDGDAEPAASCGARHRAHRVHRANQDRRRSTESTQVRYVRHGNAIYKITTTYTTR